MHGIQSKISVCLSVIRKRLRSRAARSGRGLFFATDIWLSIVGPGLRGPGRGQFWSMNILVTSHRLYRHGDNSQTVSTIKIFTIIEKLSMTDVSATCLIFLFHHHAPIGKHIPLDRMSRNETRMTCKLDSSRTLSVTQHSVFWYNQMTAISFVLNAPP